MHRLSWVLAVGAAALLMGAAGLGLVAGPRGAAVHAWAGRAGAVGAGLVIAPTWGRLRAAWRRVARLVRARGLPGALAGQAERAARRADPVLVAGAVAAGLALLPLGGGPGHAFLAGAALAVLLGALAVALASGLAMDRVEQEARRRAAEAPAPSTATATSGPTPDRAAGARV